MDKQINTSVEWRLLADRDVSVAIHLAENMHPVPTTHVVFNCQQAVEKYLKGVIAFFGEEPPYIHDLPKLCLLAENHQASIGSISALCSIITQFSVQPRYDYGLYLSEDDMRIVLNHTKRIKDFLLSEIPELFQDAD